MPTARACFAFVLFASLATVAACDNEGPSTIDGPGPAGGTSSGTPAGEPRSFRTDVMPLLTSSCAVSSCHGDRNGSAGVGIFLPLGDPDGIHADLMKESIKARGAKFVVPRDPAKSYLYAKLSGNLTDFIPTCTGGCGQVMPPPPIARMSAADLETIRLWIAEGAPNN